MRRFIFTLFFLAGLSCSGLYAQESEHQHEGEPQHEKFKHHRIAGVLGHTHIPLGSSSDGSNQRLVVPSWGLVYEYWVKPRWAIGFNGDMELMNYVVDIEGEPEVERDTPIIVALLGMYKPYKDLTIGAGPGREFEPHENFWIFRLLVEYDFEMTNNWDVAPGIVYDNKELLFDSWTLELSIGKRF